MADTPEIVEDAVKTLTEMLAFLQLEVRARGEANGRQLRLSVQTSDPGRLIGRKGRTLENVEYLLGRMLSQRHEVSPIIHLDIDGYQKRPQEGPEASPKRNQGGGNERLEKLALDAAKEVKRWGQERAIGPFSATDRRIIHMALKSDPTITSESIGNESDDQRKIVIRSAE